MVLACCINSSAAPTARAQIERRTSEMMSKLPLAKLREVLGYTQQDMADKLAVKLLAISKIEGNGSPSLRRLWRYAYAPRLRGPPGDYAPGWQAAYCSQCERELGGIKLQASDDYPADIL